MGFLTYRLLPHILNMSLTASAVIAVVLLARLLLRRAPRWCSYALWAAVLFRLLCPVSIGSGISLFNAVDAPVSGAAGGNAPVTVIDYVPVDMARSPQPEVVLPDPVPEGGADSGTAQAPQAAAEPAAGRLWTPLALLTLLWFCAAASMLMTGLLKYICLRGELWHAKTLEGRVKESPHISTAFVLGLARPAIYLPEGLTERERECVLAHERCHIRRGDHIIKPLAYMALCVHWFNPLVWLAWALAMRDIEASCDEAALKALGRDARADYAQTLLNLATGRRAPFGASLAFGDDTKRRIRALAAMRPAKRYISVLSAILAAAVIAGCAANPTGTPAPEGSAPLPSLEGEPSGRYASPEEYMDAAAAELGETTVTLAPGELVEAGVAGSRAEAEGAVASIQGLDGRGTIEGWLYRRWYSLDVPADEVMLAGGNMRDGGWFCFDGERLAILLCYPDGSYDVLGDVWISEGLGSYGSYYEYIWDWYVSENGLGGEYPPYLVDWTARINGGDGSLGNFAARRFNGEGWYAYVPVGLWEYGGNPLSSHPSWAFYSAYGTGSTVLVERLEGAGEHAERVTWSNDYEGQWSWCVEVPVNGEFHYLITASWDEGAVSANAYTATEPAAAVEIANSFSLWDGASAAAEGAVQRPSSRVSADSSTALKSAAR